MNRSSLFSTLLLLLILAPVAARAEDVFDPDYAVGADAPAIEHGKAATADASPVDPGAVEAEIGFAPSWNSRGGSAGFDLADDGSEQDLYGAITYGVVPDVDVNLGFEFCWLRDEAARGEDGSGPTRGSGLGDLALGARWRFLNVPERALEMAFTAGAVIPTGTRGGPDALGMSQEFWSARGALVATKDLGATTMNGEVALEAPVSGDASGLRSVFQANAAFGVHVLPWLQPEIELNYESTFGIRSQVLAATAGIVAPFGDGYRIVAAVQRGLWGRDTTQTTAAVLSFKSALQ
jgi:hypothetical protein